jgi:hypothetical protein
MSETPKPAPKPQPAAVPPAPVIRPTRLSRDDVRQALQQSMDRRW